MHLVKTAASGQSIFVRCPIHTSTIALCTVGWASVRSVQRPFLPCPSKDWPLKPSLHEFSPEGHSPVTGMAARVRDYDWSAGPLGRISDWPQNLRIAVDMCLNSRFPMRIWWGPDLIFIYNDAYAPILGKRHPEALGRSAPVVWPDAWPVIRPQVEAVMRRGEASWVERIHLVLERNGFPEDTWFNWSYSPIRDESGHVDGLLCVTNEVTEQVLAERERDRLAEEREKLARTVDGEKSNLASIIAQAPAFICAFRGPDHVFEVSNERYYELIGRRDIIGKPVREALPEIAGQGYFEFLDNVYRTGESYVGNESLVLLRRKGDDTLDRRFVNFVYQALRGPDGTVAGVFALGVDVTEMVESRDAERAARSELERASKIKDEFLATLSHEIRTPLNAILGWSQILRKSSAPEDLAEGLDIIERNARAQAQIVEDLLDMSRIISGKVRLDVQRLNLSAIVQAAVDTARPAADAKGVRLQSILDPLHGTAVSGDMNRLQQVMWNLLSNAVKFTPRGGRVQVLLERVNSHLEISVIDTGEGIKPEFLPLVFDRFRQADASTTRRHGGLGLGLAIVKQLVELHGGSVRVKSEGSGHGTSFTVALPLTAVHREPEAERRHPSAVSKLSGYAEHCMDIEGVRVLVVDDEPDARALVKRLLEDCHALVAVAASAGEAIALLHGGKFDVLVSDIGMPGEDGYALIKRIRALGTEYGGDIPAIALTAYARGEDRVKAIGAGFQMHVTKPVESVELVTMVASAAGRIKRES
jgi:PAS domain S-box-containing protein